MALALRERFEAKYLPEPNSGCWLWEGSMDDAGYGQIVVGGRGSQKRAHIVSLMLEGAEIPPGKNVLHKCNNKGCVNPKHLRIGNQSQNAADSLRAGNLHYNPAMAKIAGKPEVVQQIREMYATGRYSMLSLGVELGMSETSIFRALKPQGRKGN